MAISGQQLFPPYTELGWDQRAMPLDFIPVDANAKVKYIAGFGRPLCVTCMIYNDASLISFYQMDIDR